MQAAHPAAIGFVGRSGSGKTVLLERVIPRLVKRGIKVGTIKHHGHRGFNIDVEGKDSWRHRNAGSSHVVVCSPDLYASYRDLEADLSVDELLGEFDDVDLVVVEGFRDSGVPTFIVARADNPREQDRPSDLEGTNIVGTVTDIPALAQEAADKGLPAVGLDDIEKVVDLVCQVTGVGGDAK